MPKTKRMWELLFLIIIGAVIAQMAIDTIRPLVPYMLIAGVVGLVGVGVYRKMRTW